jgi:hypothetical protein
MKWWIELFGLGMIIITLVIASAILQVIQQL